MRAFKCSSFFIFILKFDVRKIIKNVYKLIVVTRFKVKRLELLTSKKTEKIDKNLKSEQKTVFNH